MALALAATALLGWSLTSFLAHVASYQSAMDEQLAHADGIVVMTGGEKRLIEGLRLLESGLARRMLISGVNPVTSRTMLGRVHKLGRHTLYDCCTDLGYAANDTAGNATETQAWVKRERFSSLIVVTANYHMPRTLAELAHVMPDVRLIPHPVEPWQARSSSWWPPSAKLHTIAREYVKYMRTTTRLHAERLAPSWVGWSDAVPPPSAARQPPPVHAPPASMAAPANGGYPI